MPLPLAPAIALGILGAGASFVISRQGIQEGLNRIVNKFAPFSLPPADVFVYAYTVGLISREDFVKFMKELGFSEHMAYLYYMATYPRASVSDLMRAYFYRTGGAIPVDEVWEIIKKELKNYGYPDEEITKIISANKFVPTVSDVLSWMAKEVFEPELVKALGLDEDLPKEFIRYCRMLGIPDEDAKRYWIAHWDVPGWSQVAEAFHRARAEAYKRGTYQAEMEKWKKIWDIFYKQAEIPRFYREMLTSITYSVITRVDARRMYELGFLSDREFASILIAQGYTKEDAERMVQWVKWETQRYGEEDLRGLTRSHVESLYELGLINDKEFVDLMKKVGVGEETAEYLLAIKKQKLYQKTVNNTITRIKNLVKKGKLDKDDARQELIRLGIDPEIASLYVEEWDVEKTAEEKELTKEDIKQAVVRGVFDLSKAYKKLREIGYSEDDAITLLRIWGATPEQIRGLYLELRGGGVS